MTPDEAISNLRNAESISLTGMTRIALVLADEVERLRNGIEVMALRWHRSDEWNIYTWADGQNECAREVDAFLKDGK